VAEGSLVAATLLATRALWGPDLVVGVVPVQESKPGALGSAGGGGTLRPANKGLVLLQVKSQLAFVGRQGGGGRWCDAEQAEIALLRTPPPQAAGDAC
jgi:hypothetical protein